MKKKYLILFVSLCLLSNTLLYAQGKVKRGDKEYDKYAFINSREYYLQVASKDPVPDVLLMRLGNSYYFTADYVNAAKWYQKYLSQVKSPQPECLYRYALSLKSSGNYHLSDSIMNQFYALKGDDFRAQLFNRKRDYLKEIDLQSDKFKIKKAVFNSLYSDFSPVFYNDSLLFSSNRDKYEIEKNIHSWNNQRFLDFYILTDIDGEEDSHKIKKFDKAINTKFHESTAVFTKDYNTIYFTRNNYFNKSYKEDSQGVNRLKLFRGKRLNNTWIIEELPFNSNEYSVAHPALSNDEKTLYFSSDMPGGYGESDLYKINITDKGYDSPVNLGNKINTEGRETFCFVSKKNEMFFSSDGHIGLGGLDVFVSEIDTQGNFGEAFNLGKPINSENDDITFILNSDTGKGYLASNRGNNPENDDIYSFTQIEKIITKCTQSLTGVVTDSKTKENVSGATVTLLDEDNNIVAVTKSGENGYYSFENMLLCQKKYSIRIETPTYKTSEIVVVTGNLPNGTLKQDLHVGKEDFIKKTDLGKVLKLEPIYFDFDKYNILPEAAKELQKIIEAMQLYPDLRINVSSHTDSRGTAVYNKNLSQKRAIATVNYIVKKGNIDPKRITGKGYGEEKIINNCTDGANCTNEEHLLNRRSEFIIVE